MRVHLNGERLETHVVERYNERYKEAVIHLEGVTDQTSAYERQRE
jgi:hypothetical protein